MALMLGMGAFMSFFTFATPLLVHYVSKKYVTEMYYNRVTDTYTAITYSLFLRKNQVGWFIIIKYYGPFISYVGVKTDHCSLQIHATAFPSAYEICE